jgi:hypothetical protein
MSPEHLPREVLLERVEQALELVSIGAQYAHYKDSAKTYTILNVGITETTNEPCVVYRADYDQDLVFVRPLSNWLETVDVDGSSVPRFVRL